MTFVRIYKILKGTKLFMSILKVVFVIIGTLIGAGFASGQEIYTFFFSYGINGIFGIIVSGIIIGFTIYNKLFYCRKICFFFFIRHFSIMSMHIIIPPLTIVIMLYLDIA